MSEQGQNTRHLLEAEITRVKTIIDAHHAQTPPGTDSRDNNARHAYHVERDALLDEILCHAHEALASGDPVAVYNALQELHECR